MVIVLSLSHIPRDGRIRRQIAAVVGAGVDVVAIGADGPVGGAPAGGGDRTVQHLTIPRPAWSRAERAIAAARLLAARPLLSETRARQLVPTIPGVAALSARLDHALADGLADRAPVLIANDWTALPAALDAQARFGVAFHYDTHELALEEHAERWDWRLLFPPLIRHIEGAGLRAARSVSCVSPGISRRMQASYGLRQPPAVVRNLPDTLPLPPRPPGPTTTVLFHGLFNPDRGLETMIAGAALWRRDARLVLRGRGLGGAYETRIAQLVTAAADPTRIAIEPAVAPDRVVAAAHAADIGLVLPSLRSEQNRYALPNKLFEYLHAGLMVIVPAATDMADLIAATGAGVALADTSPAGLARLIDGLTHEQIWRCKQAAYRAAAQLTWRTESRVLLASLGLRAAG